MATPEARAAYLQDACGRDITLRRNVDELLKAFGVEGCLWGSDWPFINVQRRPVYADVLAPLSRWLPDPGDRARVLAHNPRRLFGFGE